MVAAGILSLSSLGFPKDATRANIFDAFANSIRHAQTFLSGIHDFRDLQAGFPTKSASGMTFFAKPSSFGNGTSHPV